MDCPRLYYSLLFMLLCAYSLICLSASMLCHLVGFPPDRDPLTDPLDWKLGVVI